MGGYSPGFKNFTDFAESIYVMDSRVSIASNINSERYYEVYVIHVTHGFPGIHWVHGLHRFHGIRAKNHIHINCLLWNFMESMASMDSIEFCWNFKIQRNPWNRWYPWIPLLLWNRWKLWKQLFPSIPLNPWNSWILQISQSFQIRGCNVMVASCGVADLIAWKSKCWCRVDRLIYVCIASCYNFLYVFGLIETVFVVRFRDVLMVSFLQAFSATDSWFPLTHMHRHHPRLRCTFLIWFLCFRMGSESCENSIKHH